MPAVVLDAAILYEAGWDTLCDTGGVRGRLARGPAGPARGESRAGRPRSSKPARRSRGRSKKSAGRPTMSCQRGPARGASNPRSGPSGRKLVSRRRRARTAIARPRRRRLRDVIPSPGPASSPRDFSPHLPTPPRPSRPPDRIEPLRLGGSSAGPSNRPARTTTPGPHPTTSDRTRRSESHGQRDSPAPGVFQHRHDSEARRPSPPPRRDLGEAMDPPLESVRVEVRRRSAGNSAQSEAR